MSWFQSWFGSRRAAPMPVQPPPPPGQVRMTLDERMAFRREMVFESVREVLIAHGVLSTDYRLNVARMDARGHVYAAMVDLMTGSTGRSFDSPGELLAMEAAIGQTAKTRYRVKVSAVYWRMGEGRDGRSMQPETRRPQASDNTLSPKTSANSAATPHPRTSLFARKPNDVPDDFPDTLVEDRAAQLERVSAEELAEFARALAQAQGARQQSVKVGSRTYETDFMPME